MSIERINTKHALLVAQRGQLEQAISQANANLNATIGAIAACEELRAEILADQSKAAAKQIADEMVPEAVVTVQDNANSDFPSGIEIPLPVEPPPAPEMLPVAKFEPCDSCPYVDGVCEAAGCDGGNAVHN